MSSEEESDDELMPKAFLVDGEMPLEDGPPTNGLEYLRRVRWEAKQSPKIVVSSIDPRMYDANQTRTWLPPKIPEAPIEYLPSKEWEEDFLNSFKKLRQVITVFFFLN